MDEESRDEEREYLRVCLCACMACMERGLEEDMIKKMMMSMTMIDGSQGACCDVAIKEMTGIVQRIGAIRDVS